MKSVHILRRFQHFPPVDRGHRPAEECAAGRTHLKTGETHVKAWRVGFVGAPSNEDHVGVCPFEVDVGTGILAGDPFRFARGKRDLAVDRQRQF